MEGSMQYSRREEIINAGSHGIGIILSIIGSIVMIAAATHNRNINAVSSTAIYGLTMIGMYTMSTLYHSIKPGHLKAVLQIFDHASIYLLIAGCYTPVTLILLGGTGKAMLMFSVVWVAATVGIVLNIFDAGRFKRIGMVLYLIMGWAAVADITNIVSLLGPKGTALLVSGGIAYTVGVIFYRMKKIEFMHSIWHLFVLAGSILHYLCIFKYIVRVF